LQNINEVLAVIRENCLSHPPLNPLPSREGRQKEMLPSREGKVPNPDLEILKLFPPH